MKRFFAFSIVFIHLALRSALASGLTVAVSPVAVTNDYVGAISINISNLVSGHSVRVERILDANGNGVIDAGEISYQTFIVTNGQRPLIGGVRNLNVPGDEDLTSDTVIQTRVPYPDLSGTLDKIAAKWVYRVTDISNGSTGTCAFTTLQKIYPQGVTGQIVAAGSGAPITNCPVVLVNFNSDGGFGAMTDANGNYTLYCPPALQYAVLPIASSVIGDQSLSFSVSSNLFTTNNLTNTFADRTISGQITDSVTANGIAGVFIQAQAGGEGGLMAVGFTDTNGNYSIPVNSGQWQVKLDGAAGAEQGYIILNKKLNADTSSGSVSGKNFQLAKATALIYGSVKDNLTNAVPGLRMDANDNSNNNDIRGATDANGNYSIATLASTYNIGPDNNALSGLPYATASSTNVTMTNGQALAVNFILTRVTAHLRGFVHYANGSPVTNIQVAVSPNSDLTGNSSIYIKVGSDGSFDAGVYSNSWRVALEVQSANDANIVGPNINFNVTDGVDQNNIILFVYPTTAQIIGNVSDSTTAPVVNLDVFGNCVVNGTNYNATGLTDSSGNYFMKVFPSGWNVFPSGSDLVGRGYVIPPDQVTTVIGANNQTVNFVVHAPGHTGPSLLNAARVGTQFQFQVGGSVSQSYRVEATSDFITWVPLKTNVGNFFFADTNAFLTNRIYRAREWP